MVNGILFWIVDFKKVRSLEVPEGSSNRLSGSANIILLSRTLLLWTQSPVQEDIYIRFEVDKVETLNLGLVKIWGSIKVEIVKMKFDQDFCENFLYDLMLGLKQNSTLGSVVPLEMFFFQLRFIFVLRFPLIYLY